MRPIRLLILFFLLPVVMRGQIITTFAGNGMAGNTGDGGPATSAKINYPIGGVFDKYGNYYMAMGTIGNTIRKIDTAHVITTVAGITGLGGFSGDSGLATAAKLKNPQGVTVDTNGNVFIADATNHRIRKIDISTGIITTVAGNGVVGNSGDGGLAIAASIDNPLDVCTDRFGNLYIADANGNRVRKVNAAGIITTFAGNGNYIYGGDNGLADTSAIGSVRGICSDDTGNIYIASTQARLLKVNTQGIITTIAGTGTGIYSGDGGPAINAELIPFKVAWDKFGNIYIADENSKRIRKVNSQGIISTVTGNGIAAYSGDGGPADSAQVKDPSGVCVDKCGNLYIADAFDVRVRKVTYDSTCSYANPVDTATVIYKIAFCSKIEIYPSPTQSEISITGLSDVKDIAIINAVGQTVLRQNCSSNKATINVSGLKGGVYFIVVQDGKSGGVWSGKFVKE